MSKFLSYILYLRGVAILIVVGVHAQGNVSDWDFHLQAHDFLSIIFDGREGNGTVMFIFIGGFLFQYLTHNNFDFRKYIEKKFMFVILPYILISIPMIAYRIYTNYSVGVPAGFNEQSVFFRFLYYLVTGLHLAPFWFISAIVLFYLSSPLFHALDNPKVYRYVFPLIFLTCFFTYRPVHNANPFLSYLHYFPIYFLGMWVSYYRNQLLTAGRWLPYSLLLIYCAIAIGNLTNLLPLHESVTFEEVLMRRQIIFNVDILKTVLLCITLTLLFYRYQDKRFPFLEILGEYSFGIFFVHCIFIYGTKHVWTQIFGPVEFSLISFSIYLSFILLVSTATVFFVKKLTGRYSRILIGS